jgi:hypothetical protein
MPGDGTCHQHIVLKHNSWSMIRNVNKNTELICAREVKDIFHELPFVELEKEKSKRSKLGDEDEKRHGSLYYYDASPPTVREDMYEKPEKRDVMGNINPEGKYDEEKVVEKQLVATGGNFRREIPATDAPRLNNEIIAAEDWKKKAEVRFIKFL